MALLHRNRSRASNRRIDPERKEEILRLYQEHYPDFGSTFATEKLMENHNLQRSSETLRRWLIEAGLWRRSCRDEFYSRYEDQTLAEVREELSGYEQLYNTFRPHTALDYLTPFENYKRIQESNSSLFQM